MEEEAPDEVEMAAQAPQKGEAQEAREEDGCKISRHVSQYENFK